MIRILAVLLALAPAAWGQGYTGQISGAKIGVGTVNTDTEAVLFASGSIKAISTTSANGTEIFEALNFSGLPVLSVHQGTGVGIQTDLTTAPLTVKSTTTTAGIRRIAKFEHQSPAVDGNGVVMEFSASTTDGFGAQVGGVREGTGGTGSFIVRTGGSSQVERFRIENSGHILTPSSMTFTNADPLVLSTMSATYVGGSAYVCVTNTGQIIASESACP